MNNTGMELPGAPFLYTMGILGMTFIGFSAIVMLLRQTLGRKLPGRDNSRSCKEPII
jgi:hypothetical protein